jgi:hypothetical protein
VVVFVRWSSQDINISTESIVCDLAIVFKSTKHLDMCSTFIEKSDDDESNRRNKVYSWHSGQTKIVIPKVSMAISQLSVKSSGEKSRSYLVMLLQYVQQ